MNEPTRPKEESARLGEAIYERDIEALVKDTHDGQFVAIDVDSGVWAVGSDLLEARKHLDEKQQETLDVWLVRVGYRAVASIGGGSPRRHDDGAERYAGGAQHRGGAIMTAPSRPKEEIKRLGEEIYERDIHALVKDTHDGQFLTIDVDSGAWAVGSDELEAVNRLREKQPGELDVWLLRVGYLTSGSIGGGSPRRRE